VSRYADRLGLTPERLNKLTRAETGQAALDIVHERLAREACRRLTSIAAPISRLAFELGFEDPAYFCRFFKRRVGQNPRDYRRAMAADAAA
jgi:AraC family transcriptional regulator, transcriptional activator of pobA